MCRIQVLKRGRWDFFSALAQSLTPVAAALPSAPNKAVSTATATFAIVFQCRIILSSFL